MIHSQGTCVNHVTTSTHSAPHHSPSDWRVGSPSLSCCRRFSEARAIDPPLWSMVP